MFAKLRGSSDEERPERSRSTQSTPRMNRHRIHDVQPDPHGGSQSVHHSMEALRMHRIRDSSSEREREKERMRVLNRSWDVVEPSRLACDKYHDKAPPRGLDRSWEAERTRGLELMYRSLEREKERRGQKERERNKDRHSEKGRDKHSKRERCELSKEYLERKLDDITKQLQEEKQYNRKDKLMVAKLQRELARHKSEGPVRESLMRELERERMLRGETEHRLRDMTVENDNCKSRLEALQDDFRKMEEMVRGLMQYKNKMDRLKQEKAKLTLTYENTIEKYKTHIGNLEQENRILLAEMKKLETQCGNCQLCNKELSYRVNTEKGQLDEKERSRMLMERLRQMEAENSALVLENEQQRGQYDKCLDQIAGQVVQALLTQKSLREECMKLQKRVIDLEQQNQQLSQMFQQRLRYASDSFLQSYMSKKLGTKTPGDGASLSNQGSSHSLPVHTQAGRKSIGHFRNQQKGGETSGGAICDESFDSLQSICSDYNENVACDESLGKPEMSSPPPWLRDKLNSSGLTDDSAAEFSGKIETEFPPSAASPKMRRIGEHKHEASAFELVQPRDNVAKTKKAATVIQHQAVIEVSPIKDKALSEIGRSASGGISPSKEKNPHQHTQVPSGDNKQNDPQSNLKNAPMDKPGPKSRGAQRLDPKLLNSQSKGGKININGDDLMDVSPGKELLKLSDSFDEKYLISERDGLPIIGNQMLMLDSSSDEEDAKMRPVSNVISIGSTISLNELLEREVRDTVSPSDEFGDEFITIRETEQEREKVDRSDEKYNKNAGADTTAKEEKKNSKPRKSESDIASVDSGTCDSDHHCDRTVCGAQGGTTQSVTQVLAGKADIGSRSLETLLQTSYALSGQRSGPVMSVQSDGRGVALAPKMSIFHPGVHGTGLPATSLLHSQVGIGKSRSRDAGETDSEKSGSTLSRRSGASTLSPDSMQQSFTSSSSSDNVLAEKQVRDDGYSSMSLSSSDTHVNNQEKSVFKVPRTVSRPCEVVCVTPTLTESAMQSTANSKTQTVLDKDKSSSKGSLTEIIEGDEESTVKVKEIRAFFEGKAQNMKLGTESSRDGRRGSFDEKNASRKKVRYSLGANIVQQSRRLHEYANQSHGANTKHLDIVSTEHEPTSTASAPCLLEFLSRNRKYKSQNEIYFGCFSFSDKVTKLRRTLSESDMSNFDSLTSDLRLTEMDRQKSLSCDLTIAATVASSHSEAQCKIRASDPVYHVTADGLYRVPNRPSVEGSEVKVTHSKNKSLRPNALGAENQTCFTEQTAQQDFSLYQTERGGNQSIRGERQSTAHSHQGGFMNSRSNIPSSRSHQMPQVQNSGAYRQVPFSEGNFRGPSQKFPNSLNLCFILGDHAGSKNQNLKYLQQSCDNTNPYTFTSDSHMMNNTQGGHNGHTSDFTNQRHASPEKSRPIDNLSREQINNSESHRNRDITRGPISGSDAHKNGVVSREQINGIDNHKRDDLSRGQVNGRHSPHNGDCGDSQQQSLFREPKPPGMSGRVVHRRKDGQQTSANGKTPSNGTDMNSLPRSNGSLLQNKHLENLRLLNAAGNRLSDISVLSQASFETMSDTCFEEFASSPCGSEDD